MLGIGRYLTGTPTSALLHPILSEDRNLAAFIRVTPWLPTDAGDLRRLRYEIPSALPRYGSRLLLSRWWA